ncbi:MAG: hypothetical protein JXD23_08200 [Spirochaetales bacterium]|nr:hypothetical protein [Spirochaetales bacterium]
MKRIFLVLLFAGAAAVPAFAQFSTFVAGVGLEPLVLPDASGTPVLFWTIGAEGIFSLKTPVGENGSFSLFAKAKGGVALDDPFPGLDSEYLQTELRLPAGEGRLDLRVLATTSFLGTMTSEIVYHPEWEARFYFLTAAKKINPYIAYNGFLRVRPESDTDVFSEGGEAGFEYSPSYLEEYRICIRGAWEYWYQSPLYTAGGIQTDSFRGDFLAALAAKAGGIAGLFLDWDLELTVALRLSNANRYLTAFSFLEENSETSATVSLRPSFDWVPLTSLALKLRPLASYTIYFDRRAVTSGSLSTDWAFVFAAGGSFEFDWSPLEALHLILTLDGEWRYSNDDELAEWKLLAGIGIKISFDLFPHDD